MQAVFNIFLDINETVNLLTVVVIFLQKPIITFKPMPGIKFISCSMKGVLQR